MGDEGFGGWGCKVDGNGLNLTSMRRAADDRYQPIAPASGSGYGAGIVNNLNQNSPSRRTVGIEAVNEETYTIR